MTNLLRYGMACLIAAAGLHASPSAASVIIGGTRVVYPSQEREVTVKLTNQGSKPALVQVWMDDGDEKSTPDMAKVPFTVTPPIFRMDGGKGQAVRLVYTKEPLPTDKESLFWLNVLEVPPKAANSQDQNQLQFAFRTRIKVFFRPVGLPGEVETAPDKLVWKLVSDKSGKGYALEVSNPTPYYVNFAAVGLKIGEQSIRENGGGMVAPGATTTFPIPQLKTSPSGEAQAQFELITDYGAVNKKLMPLAR